MKGIYMKRGSTLILRATLVFMALVAAAVCIFALPSIYSGAGAEFPGAQFWLAVLIGSLYVSAVPFLIALLQAWKLLNYIDKNQAFSHASVVSLRAIKYCALGVTVCFVAGIPYLFHVAQIDDAPGLGLMALALACAPLVVATFAAVLEKLFANANKIKSENDLTV